MSKHPTHGISTELEPYRRLFARVNTTNPTSLRRWFETHPYFTNYLHAQIAQVPLEKIRDWRALAGYPRGTQRVPPTKRIRVNTLTRPPGKWTDPDWLIPAYNLTHSPKTIAEMAGVDRVTVSVALVRLGITRLGPIVHHCNNRQWIQDHYVNQGISLARCAQQAGVNRETFTRWVIKHGFQVRTARQAQAAQQWGAAGIAHIWARELAYKLEQHPAIKAVKMTDRGLTVRYRHTLVEQYRWDMNKAHHSLRIFPIDQAGARHQRDIPIHEQYPGEDYDSSPYPHHVIINSEDWERASFVERRIALHVFMIRVRSHHIPTYQYPRAVLDQAWQQLGEQDPRVFLHQNVLRLASKGTHYNYAWPIILHFVPLRPELVRLWGRYKDIYRAFCELTTDTELSICTGHLIRMGCKLYGPKIFNPNVYRCLLAALKLPAAATVLDLHPGTGLKAIACALLGLKYRYPAGPGSERWEAACRAGLSQFMGLDCEPWDGTAVELVIADDELRVGVDLAEILGGYSAVARRLVCLVSAGRREELQAQHRPDSVIGVKSKLYAKQLSYLFVW